MVDMPVFEKITLTRGKGRDSGKFFSPSWYSSIDFILFAGEVSLEDDSPFSKLEEGKEISLLDEESKKSAKVQHLVHILKEWINVRLSKENIVVRDLQEDLYDGQIIHKIMRSSFLVKLYVNIK